MYKMFALSVKVQNIRFLYFPDIPHLNYKGQWVSFWILSGIIGKTGRSNDIVTFSQNNDNHKPETAAVDVAIAGIILPAIMALFQTVSRFNAYAFWHERIWCSCDEIYVSLWSSSMTLPSERVTLMITEKQSLLVSNKRLY